MNLGWILSFKVKRLTFWLVPVSEAMPHRVASSFNLREIFTKKIVLRNTRNEVKVVETLSLTLHTSPLHLSVGCLECADPYGCTRGPDSVNSLS